MNSRRQTRIILIVLGSFAAVVVAITILWNNYLLPWQIPLFKIRKAIIEYVREEHPKSEIAEGHIQYGATGFGFIIEIYPDCYITFEESGFQYVVDYNHKDKSVIDYYKKAKLANDVRVFINEEFLKPRGIENVDVYCDFGFKSPSELPNEWSEYDDSYTVQLDIHDQGSTPREVGWIYDFYKFWEEHMIFSPSWYMEFIICDIPDEPDGFLYVSYESNCINAADLYSGFI